MQGIFLGELALELSGECLGNPKREIFGVGSLALGTEQQIGFVADSSFVASLASSSLGAIIISRGLREQLDRDGIVVDNPHVAFARAAARFDSRPPANPGVHPSAIIADDVVLPVDVSIGPGVVVEPGVSLGAGCELGPGCVIESGVSIGERCVLRARVTVCHGVVIGDDCLFHPGVVVGSDGFGLALDGDRWIKVPQVGSVQIGSNCEFGANTTIDRGAIDDTCIGNGVKVDNQVQIAHNVIIGDHSAIAGCVGIAGSAVIGKRCRIGGNAGILGHLNICDDTTIMAKSLVTKTIRSPGVYSSAIPVTEQAQWGRQLARLRRIDSLAERVGELEKHRKSESDD